VARYPAYGKPRRSKKRLLALLILVAAAAVGAWMIFGGDDDPADPPPPAPKDNGATSRTATTQDATPLPPGTAEQRAAAMAAYRRGMMIKEQGERDPAKQDRVALRAALSEAVLSGHLPRDVEASAVRELTTLANTMIFSPRAYGGDSYARQYVFMRGDSISEVERELKLCVSWQGLLRVNNLTNPRRILAGQALKMIKGPFHAIVYKSRHIMDIYLQRDNMEKVFVRRIPVGLGRDGITPLGNWRVINRLERADYFPPVSSGLGKRQIRYGEPGYAFGTKGLWIGLAGTDAQTARRTGYGLHSTNDQASIGKDASAGCIRLADADIDMVYAYFYEQRTSDMNPMGLIRWSTVQIRP